MKLRTRALTALSALYLILVVFASSANAKPVIGVSHQTSTTESQQPQQPDNKLPDMSTATSAVFTGTIVKSGDDFVLKDASGKTYILDTPEKAQPFVGKSVKVTGKLEADAKLLHVEAIEEITA